MAKAKRVNSTSESSKAVKDTQFDNSGENMKRGSPIEKGGKGREEGERGGGEGSTAYIAGLDNSLSEPREMSGKQNAEQDDAERSLAQVHEERGGDSVWVENKEGDGREDAGGRGESGDGDEDESGHMKRRKGSKSDKRKANRADADMIGTQVIDVDYLGMEAESEDEDQNVENGIDDANGLQGKQKGTAATKNTTTSRHTKHKMQTKQVTWDLTNSKDGDIESMGVGFSGSHKATKGAKKAPETTSDKTGDKRAASRQSSKSVVKMKTSAAAPSEQKRTTRAESKKEAERKEAEGREAAKEAQKAIDPGDGESELSELSFVPPTPDKKYLEHTSQDGITKSSEKDKKKHTKKGATEKLGLTTRKQNVREVEEDDGEDIEEFVAVPPRKISATKAHQNTASNNRNRTEATNEMRSSIAELLRQGQEMWLQSRRVADHFVEYLKQVDGSQVGGNAQKAFQRVVKRKDAGEIEWPSLPHAKRRK
ncbi:hypothetical protein N0V90_010348 [Kalmusia sp. IMI 367209]|nr:hypothetical protein N0V90_010348 [Kalmusia sp. IMI 367209]